MTTRRLLIFGPKRAQPRRTAHESLPAAWFPPQNVRRGV